MPTETETIVIDKLTETHKKANRKLTKKLLSSNKFRALAVVILCGLIGGGFFLVKAATTTYSLWNSSTVPRVISSQNASSIELGVKFKSANSGYVTGISFYKAAQNTGTHVGSLWTSNGTLLASVSFTKESSSGWQTATLAQPINIAANVTYVVSYFAPAGHYSYNNNYFNRNRAYTNGPLSALASNYTNGANGVYVNTAAPAFPTHGLNGTNFWVDLVFSTQLVSAPVAPAPPTTVTATQNGSSIVVSWNAGISSKPIASYNVLRNGSLLTNVSSTTLTYTDSSITAGQTYNYQIETIDNTAAVSAASVTASVTYNVAASCPTGDTGTPPNCVAPPVSTGRPAGLIQAGNSKTVCITNGPNPNSYTEMDFTTLNGITYNCMATYTDADPAWSNWVSPWIASANGAPFVAWVAANPNNHSLIDAQNLIPDSEESNANWTTECDAGDYNTYATQFAQNMVSAGLGYTVIRLAHEMNGTWYNDDLGPTQAQWTQWDLCWDQEVTAMRAVPGVHFLFDWNVNANYQDFPLADIYPGNAYVDIIGIDAYDNSGITLPAVGQPGRFAALAGEPDGLDAVLAFAQAQGKPLSIPEWGTMSTQGDDAAYVQGIAGIVDNNNVAYQAYFNANDDNVYPLDSTVAPQTVAAYVATFK